MTTDLHAFADEWIAAWNAHDLDRILSHYAPEIVFESPVIRSRYGKASGRVEGLTELRDYWSGAFVAFPDLRFELLSLFHGIEGGAIRYRNHARDIEVIEVFRFGADGRVTWAAAYNPA